MPAAFAASRGCTAAAAAAAGRRATPTCAKGKGASSKPRVHTNPSPGRLSAAPRVGSRARETGTQPQLRRDDVASPVAAAAAAAAAPDDLSGALNASTLEVGDFAKLDLGRTHRTGLPEVVWGPGKTPAQILSIMHALAAGPARHCPPRHKMPRNEG